MYFLLSLSLSPSLSLPLPLSLSLSLSLSPSLLLLLYKKQSKFCINKKLDAILIILIFNIFTAADKDARWRE